MRTSRAALQRIMPVSPALKALVGSTGRAKLLAHFFLHPGEAFHIRELARLLGESPGSLVRELRRLEAVRLLQTERVGNQVRYSLDQKHPLHRDLQRMILKDDRSRRRPARGTAVGARHRIGRTPRLLRQRGSHDPK